MLQNMKIKPLFLSERIFNIYIYINGEDDREIKNVVLGIDLLMLT